MESYNAKDFSSSKIDRFDATNQNPKVLCEKLDKVILSRIWKEKK